MGREMWRADRGSACHRDCPRGQGPLWQSLQSRRCLRSYFSLGSLIRYHLTHRERSQVHSSFLAGAAGRVFGRACCWSQGADFPVARAFASSMVPDAVQSSILGDPRCSTYRLGPSRIVLVQVIAPHPPAGHSPPTLDTFHSYRRTFSHGSTHLTALHDVMLILDTTNTEPCYFTIRPPTHSHFSTETPCYLYTPSIDEHLLADPTNPLLAYRDQYPIFTTSPSPAPSKSVMQAQTSASHGHSTSRPRAVPTQNLGHSSSRDSSSSSSTRSLSSSSDDNMATHPEYARCSRCQRTPSLDIKSGKSNMVQYGLNLWYCNRCAGMVGMTNR